MIQRFAAFASAGLGIALVLAIAPLGARTSAQSEKLPAIAAVSIRPFLATREDRPEPLSIDPGGLRAYGVTLRQLVVVAYDAHDYQVVGGDAWLSDRYWSFNATAEARSTPSQIRLMLRSALASRFGLRVAEQTTTTPVYALVIAPGGLRIPKLASGQHPDYPGGRRPGECAYTELSSFAGLASLFNWPRPMLGRPVVDQTGTTGAYNIALFLPCTKVERPRLGNKIGNRFQLSAAMVGPEIRRQLGVELKPTVLSQTTITIVGAHLPTPN